MDKEVKTFPGEICNSDLSVRLQTEHSDSLLLWVGVGKGAAYLFIFGLS